MMTFLAGCKTAHFSGAQALVVPNVVGYNKDQTQAVRAELEKKGCREAAEFLIDYMLERDELRLLKKRLGGAE